MKTPPLCFLHGLDSSPCGTKGKLLKRYFPGCLIPKLPPDIHKRLEIVQRIIRTPTLIAGSSLGGLTAIMYAMQHPGMVKGLVLMAPAVGPSLKRLMVAQKEDLVKSLIIPKGISTIIIAGVRDELIPVSAIRTLVQRSPEPHRIRLHEVNDDHLLHRSIDLMLSSIKTICYNSAPGAE